MVWLRHKRLARHKTIQATDNYKDILKNNFLVHFIAIPTEKDGKLYFKILFDVLKDFYDKKLSFEYKPLIIID